MDNKPIKKKVGMLIFSIKDEYNLSGENKMGQLIDLL